MANNNNKPNFRTGKVTQGIFDAVKILLENNDNISEIAKFMKLSWDTVRIISNSETLGEYKQQMYLKSSCYRKRMKAELEKEKKVAEAEKQKEAEKVAKEVGAVPASELVKKDPEQVVEHRQTVIVQASHYMLEEQKKTNELLELISKKLGRIIDDLYGIKGGEE